MEDLNNDEDLVDEEGRYTRRFWFGDIVARTLHDLSRQAAQTYLGTHGDAVDRRVSAALKEAEALLATNHPGPSLALAATALELMIRFLLLQPLVQSAFKSGDWARVLTDRIVHGTSNQDRRLLPEVLRQWGIDVTRTRTPNGIALWDFMTKQLWNQRNNFVHKYEDVPSDVAAAALECARVFREEIVGAVARDLGFMLGHWSQTDRGGIVIEGEFEPGDPFSAKGH